MAIKSQNHTYKKLWHRMWHSKDVYDTLMPLYKASKLLGLCPYSYKTEGGSYKYVMDKLHTSYSILFLILYIVFFTYATNDSNRIKLVISMGGGKVTNFIDTFQWYAAVLAMSTLILANCLHRKILIEAVGEMALVDEKIENYGLQINHATAKKEVTGAVAWQVIAFIIMERLNCSLFLKEMRITSALCYTLCYIPLMISGFVKSQFVVLVVLLRYRFEALNGKLKTLTRLQCRSNAVSLKIQPLQFVQALPSVKMVSTIRKIHGQLCDLSCRINKAFYIQILCIVGYNFVSFTAHAYFCMESYIKIYIEKCSVDFELATTTVWAFVKLSVLFHLTYTCTQTKNEALESGIIIHKIQNRYQDAILDEITAFSKQILHWDFKFTAFDLFEIDMSIFYMMVTSASTYLIILIQMDVALNKNFLNFVDTGSANTSRC